MIDQAHYDLCIANGQSHNIAEICASGIAPAPKTATRRAASEHSVNKVWGWQTKGIEAQAKRHGLTPQSGYVYRPELADDRGAGDPLAWCHPHEVLAHKKKVCAKRNQSLVDENGKRLVKRVVQEPNRVKLSDTIVNDKLALMAQKHPEINKVPVKELVKLRREIVERHGSKG